MSSIMDVLPTVLGGAILIGATSMLLGDDHHDHHDHRHRHEQRRSVTEEVESIGSFQKPKSLSVLDAAGI
jgi:hypothetical protein